MSHRFRICQLASPPAGFISVACCFTDVVRVAVEGCVSSSELRDEAQPDFLSSLFGD